jgi:outer membrane receptor protein involved in Fe transport
MLSVSLAGLATQAWAQGAEQAPSDASDIVVTANKRVQNLNDVGQTITAISGDSLKEQRITSLADVASAVPGLSFSPSTTNTPIFTLRGVGYNEQSLAVYPTVSVYLDQAPLTFPALGARAAFDLERIEVLKGPQGTIFGQNSTGGAVNYIAAKPTDTFRTGADITYGRFNEISGNAFVSGPLGPTLKGRIAVTGAHIDDWQRSTTRSDTLGEVSYFAGRMILDWKPTDTARLELNINGWQDKSDPQAQQLVAVLPGVPQYLDPRLAAYQFATNNVRDADWTPNGPGLTQRPKSNRKLFQAFLRGDIDITDDIQLTSLTSYIHFTQRQNSDGDGTYLSTFDLAKDNGKIDTFFQELRLSNGDSGRARWVLGANFEKSKVNEELILNYVDNSTHNPTTLFIQASGVNSYQNLRNYAFFANLEYDVSDLITLHGGARYTNNRVKQNICNYDAGNGELNALFTILGNTLSGQVVPPLGPGDCYSLNFDNIPGDPYINTLQEDNVSWRFAADFHAADNLLLYASVSRGYKGGNFAVITASTFAQYEPVTQESVTAYEAGFKAQLFGKKANLTGAAFYYDYKDKQIRGKILDNLFGLLESQVNIPRSRIAGAELEATVRPVSGMTLSGIVTYLDSKVLEYSGYDIVGVVQNFRGAPLPLTPKWQLGVAADFRPDTGNPDIQPFFGANVNYRSETAAALRGATTPLPSDVPGARTAPGIEFPYKIPSYITVDIRAGLEFENGRYKLMAWGKNILNEQYVTNVIPGSDTISRFVGRPATYGVTFAFNY